MPKYNSIKDITYLPIRRVKENVSLFFRKIKWRYQRINHGFCDYDIWNFDDYLSGILTDGLRQLADTAHSYPGIKDAPGETFEEWQQYLRETAAMIEDGLKIGDDEENPYDFTYSCPELLHNGIRFSNNDKYFQFQQELDNKRLESLNMGLERVIKIYRNLWD